MCNLSAHDFGYDENKQRNLAELIVYLCKFTETIHHNNPSISYLKTLPDFLLSFPTVPYSDSRCRSTVAKFHLSCS